MKFSVAPQRGAFVNRCRPRVRPSGDGAGTDAAGRRASANSTGLASHRAPPAPTESLPASSQPTKGPRK